MYSRRRVKGSLRKCEVTGDLGSACGSPNLSGARLEIVGSSLPKLPPEHVQPNRATAFGFQEAVTLIRPGKTCQGRQETSMERACTVG